MRHKVHSRAFASFDGMSSGMVLDLTEVLDLSESGMSVKANTPLAPNRSLNFVLDLSETKSYINASGFVVWSDDSGRAGIQFSALPEYKRRQLKEWLFVNALAAFAKGAAQAAQAVRAEPEVDTTWEFDEEQFLAQPPTVEQKRFDQPQPRFEQQVVSEQREARAIEAPRAVENVPQAKQYSDVSVDAPTLNAIQRQVDALSSDPGSALNLLVSNAQSLTRSSGGAIALASGAEMVCRASSGEAPPLGARFQVGLGFSGQCVRTGQLQHCLDSETDPRVDRQSCRDLGIRSMVAVPVTIRGKVLGLLEVFSPAAMAFGESDVVALQRLTNIVEQFVEKNGLVELPIVEKNALVDLPKEAMQPWPKEQGGVRLHIPPQPQGGVRQEVRAAVRPETRPETRVAVQPAAAVQYEYEPPVSPSRNRIILMTVVAALAIASMAAVVSWRLRLHHRAGEPTSLTEAVVSAAAPVTRAPAQPMTLDELRKRATAGDPIAQYAIGARYAQGDEVKKDYAEAVRWFNKAADQGHVGAQTALGAYYWAGRGVAQDLSKAYYWSVLARAGNDETAKYRVSALTSRMTRSQLHDAQQRADDWLHQHQATPEQ